MEVEQQLQEQTSSDNPLFITPAKPSRKKDRKQDQNKSESDTIISGQGQGLVTVPAPYMPHNVPHHYPMSVPPQQNIDGERQFRRNYVHEKPANKGC